MAVSFGTARGRGWRLGGLLLAVLVAGVAGLVSPRAVAQDYPSRPVKMYVPYAAGGLPDVIARVVGQRLSEVLGQQFVIENKPGAGGISAMQAAAQAPADGYTLIVADVGQVSINPFLFSNLPYDPVKDYAPISLIALSPLFIVAGPQVEAKTFQELVALARARPGKLNYGSSGIGSIHHIAMEAMKSALGLDIVHVPYKGTGQSVPAFIGGEVQLVLSAVPSIAPYVKTGQARLLAVSSRERYAPTPDVPSLAEFIPDYDFPAEIGMLAPAGTPAAIVSRLGAAVADTVKDAGVQARFETIGAQGVGLSPAAYTEHIRRGLERYRVAVKISGAKAD